MTAIASFLPKVYQYAPNCAEPAALDAIRSAAIEFCERTRLWRTTLALTVTTAMTVTLTPISDSVIHDIETIVWDNGKVLEPVTTRYLDERFPLWRAEELTGQPSYYTQLTEDAITFAPFEAGTASAYVRLKPTYSCTTLPDFIFNRYLDVIRAGVLARLLMLPGQIFYDPAKAAIFQKEFQDHLDRLSGQGNSGQQRAPRRTKARFF